LIPMNSVLILKEKEMNVILTTTMIIVLTQLTTVDTDSGHLWLSIQTKEIQIMMGMEMPVTSVHKCNLRRAYGTAAMKIQVLSLYFKQSF
jgi:hypothetical protein